MASEQEEQVSRTQPTIETDIEKPKSIRTETEPPTSSEQDAINVDDILTDEIGQFGKFHWKMLFLCGILMMLTGASTRGYIFSAARINSRCFIEECDVADPDFSPSWILNAVPGTVSSLDNCNRFVNTTFVDDEGVCPPELFDRDTTRSCDSYIYSHSQTVAYDFDLACNEWRRTLIGSIRMFGSFFSLPITGYISDRWGRRTALTFNAFNMAWIGASSIFITNYYLYLVNGFFEGLIGFGGMASCLYILTVEQCGPKVRVTAGTAMNACFTLGQVYLAFLAWLFPFWKHLVLAIYLPQLVIVIVFYFLIAESVRWYLSKGKYNQADKGLKYMAKSNGKQLSNKTLEMLKEAKENKKIEKEERKSGVEKKKSDEPLLILQVLRNKVILFRCMVTPWWWLSTTFVNLGLSVYSVNIAGNQYINYMLISLIDIPGFYIAVMLMNKVGRKPLTIGSYFLCTVTLLGYMFVPKDDTILPLIVYMLAKSFSAMMQSSMYVYTAELYPTKYRHNLFAFSKMMGRVGSTLGPLTPAMATLWEQLPFVLFSSMAFVSGVLACFMPETIGTELPETMEEATNMGQKTDPEK